MKEEPRGRIGILVYWSKAQLRRKWLWTEVLCGSVACDWEQ
jgi:hypothetical protein